ncbi:tRNA (N6-threonylcarbamoyladenosine(37)-N6)-methyltransferase TrmO [Rosenbergiella australiborealis]|uniref:tRNA (N6-threonylcarbamoyladenosine(37)-N6)-methyltransferase TrmO n=1 Tax=Rosenbergiella australiborealis TaxID=1544696 RepID=A0ABS5T1T8_9GAMM|nr:tRNA (N6-threonylcarbamoyladenosine(37)-N6)-methyltransferase TrmO [Rosenbergiella australiborealis]MBT0726266.1 tRNA (N6-threonylcarbamoyladenosine(37)-N6)-methyltransferase TrmO [Rosenbergiella australiborealis]
MNTFSLQQIGVIHSPWKEKFAVPRQPGLVTAMGAELELIAPYNQLDTLRGIENFSHLWLLFIFHHTRQQGWKPLVRPPRLGGNDKIGVFASRSTFRPNPIGMSLVEFRGVRQEKKRLILELGSVDLVDGTPIIDIKPYLPFAESLPEAHAGYAQSPPEATMPIFFSPTAQQQLMTQAGTYPYLGEFIQQVLAQDPRPAYRRGKEDDHFYAASLSDFTVRWRVTSLGTEVIAIEPTN